MDHDAFFITTNRRLDRLEEILGRVEAFMNEERDRRLIPASAPEPGIEAETHMNPEDSGNTETRGPDAPDMPKTDEPAPVGDPETEKPAVDEPAPASVDEPAEPTATGTEDATG